MTRIYLLLFALVLTSLAGCDDKCRETRTYRRYTNVTLTAAQVHAGVALEEPRALEKPGKIYTKDGYLYINELKQGIHLIDNRDPANPRPVAFLRIPGNGDMAVRNNILYADSYMDLVAFDISNPAAVREVNRVPNVFPGGQFEGGWWSFDQQSVTLSDQQVSYVTETIQTNCENTTSSGGWWGGCPSCMTFASAQNAPVAPGATNGVAGSMARFALYDRYLYTVSQQDMQLFNIQSPENPVAGQRINLGWGIETIFPYRDKLFIGSNSGMFIYNNANPAKPERMAVFQHARVCDPVVVNDKTAYVTLRSGNTCQGFTNQLDVVDITDLYNPKLLKSYPMSNPHGLGVDFPNLFICDGADGLKSFDAADALNIRPLQQLAGADAYDVIPLGGTPLGSATGQKLLLMVGKDGLYQFDYSNPRQLRMLSKLTVNRPY